MSLSRSHTTLLQCGEISVKCANGDSSLICLTAKCGFHQIDWNHLEVNERDSISNLKISVYNLPASVWNCPFFSANVEVMAQQVHTLCYLQSEAHVICPWKWFAVIISWFLECHLFSVLIKAFFSHVSTSSFLNSYAFLIALPHFFLNNLYTAWFDKIFWRS